METIQISLAIFEFILFGIFFACINYLFYLLTFKNGLKTLLSKLFNLIVFCSIDLLAIYIIINIFNF